LSVGRQRPDKLKFAFRAGREMRIFWFLSLLLYLTPGQDLATALVVLRTDSQILVAADSKTISIEGYGAKRCKILIAPNHIFAAAGIFRQNGAFDAFEIAKRLLSTSASHSEIVTSYKNEMLHVIPDVVQKIKNQTPQYFVAKVRDQEAFQAVFGTSEEGVLKVSVVGFVPSNNGSISVKQKDCPGQCDTTLAWFASLGAHALIDAEVNSNSHIWKNLGIVGALDRLIALEAEGRPAYVSGPVSIAVLQQNGRFEWKQLGSCEQ
jgi:hypothetical protein